MIENINFSIKMKHYTNFNFERYTFNEITWEATFCYNFDEDLFFEEKICFFDEHFQKRNDMNIKIINNILLHIHIALWISYYKFYPTKNLILKTWNLETEWLNFWKKFYLNGLGEFFYRNNIDPNWLLNFECQSDIIFEKINFNTSEKYLVPIGWWKDSIVSIELLKKMWKNIDGVTFAVNDNILYENTAIHARIKRLFIKRYINDYKNLIEAWYYNWHVPITGMIAFVLELTCYIYDYKYIVLSNEKSANFWNTLWKWVEINHQWSKSLDFEKDFGNYVSKYIWNNVKYFSLLRPLYELKIAKLFAIYAKKYFTSFSSCNTNFKIFKKENNWKLPEQKYWCNNCPKCAFVYSILRPFLSSSETISIFWKELYDEKKLETLFRELAWISWIKPFECVGTNEEVILAMKMAYEKWEWKKPFILEIFQNELHSHMTREKYEILERKIFIPDYEENIIPQDLLQEFKKIIYEF